MVLWDLTELMVASMEGELVAKLDYPFPEGATYLSLKPSRLVRYFAELLSDWESKLKDE